ncbi:uncharacterized protein CTRU02_204870 [Colletotrichum truncatum]|uniref:Uncharacterized protein n=1 Tax=Colletotrichum truncatum TaxID=5467 RepID=A0ACC3ZDB1_COLTU
MDGQQTREVLTGSDTSTFIQNHVRLGNIASSLLMVMKVTTPQPSSSFVKKTTLLHYACRLTRLIYFNP